MARIRTIKPEFFKNSSLHKAEKSSGFPLRIAFAGLWCCADRDGRGRWKPDELKLDCLPYDTAPTGEPLDFEAVMVALERNDSIRSYVVDGKKFWHIPAWSDHQAVNPREAPSVLPPPPCQNGPTPTRDAPDDDASVTRAPRHPTRDGPRGDAAPEEGKGREGKGREGESASMTDAQPPNSAAAFSLSPVNGKSKPVVGGNPITLKSFFARCEEAHVDPIPDDDPVFAYAAKAGIPSEFIHLAWKEFRRKHLDRPKKYANWRMAFRNCVEQGWYKLWAIDSASQYVLTSAGKQAKKVNGA